MRSYILTTLLVVCHGKCDGHMRACVTMIVVVRSAAISRRCLPRPEHCLSSLHMTLLLIAV